MRNIVAKKAFLLALCIGGMLLICTTEVSAKKYRATYSTLSSQSEEDLLTKEWAVNNEEEKIEDEKGAEKESESKKDGLWIDKHPKKVGFTYAADANIVANYIWRGLYVGGPSLQASARIGYGGLFADMWWNIGSENWAFEGLLPELDLSVGFSRWNWSLYVIHMCFFDGTGLFDLRNNAPGKPGNTTELRTSYKISERIPLSVLWCTRFTSRDGYEKDGELVRAWSSYLELGYDAKLPYEMALIARVGMTPWKSMYTGYKGDFAVNNISLALRKDWTVSKHCGMHVTGQVMVNPWQISKENIKWDSHNPGEQRLNANITYGVYLIQ